LIEERGGGTHHVTDLVETFDALPVRGDRSSREVGSEVLCWCERVGCGVPGTHLVGVNLVDGGVEGDNLGVW